MKTLWISRIRSGSHSLWILKRFFDFLNDSCVRVRVLIWTVRTGYGFTRFWIMQSFSVKGGEVKTLPEFCLKVWSCFFDPWLRIFAGKNRFHFFLYSSGSDSVKSFASSLFFSFSDSVIGAGVPRLWWGIRALNCREINSMMKIHQWVSENWWVCDEFVMNFWFWKTRVYAFVLRSWWIFCFDPNCQEREWEICLCDVACNLWILLILTLCPIYKLPCGIWSNELVTCGPEHLRGNLDWLAIWKKLGTELQKILTKGLPEK